MSKVLARNNKVLFANDKALSPPAGGNVETRIINYIGGQTIYYTNANLEVVTVNGSIDSGVQAAIGTLVCSTGVLEPMPFPTTGVASVASIDSRLDGIRVYRVIP